MSEKIHTAGSPTGLPHGAEMPLESWLSRIIPLRPYRSTQWRSPREKRSRQRRPQSRRRPFTERSGGVASIAASPPGDHQQPGECGFISTLSRKFNTASGFRPTVTPPTRHPQSHSRVRHRFCAHIAEFDAHNGTASTRGHRQDAKGPTRRRPEPTRARGPDPRLGAGGIQHLFCHKPPQTPGRGLPLRGGRQGVRAEQREAGGPIRLLMLSGPAGHPAPKGLPSLRLPRPAIFGSRAWAGNNERGDGHDGG